MGAPPYGVRSPRGSGRIEPDPAEYPHARRIADELLTGKSAMRVAHDLERDGIRTRDGARWDARDHAHGALDGVGLACCSPRTGCTTNTVSPSTSGYPRPNPRGMPKATR
ncbi:recombinase family protein [Streptomyces sp. UP1A-1]|nr:recombinase family protein [Streptomyces sp. UP1A-1]